jgi:hypothetical protein
MAFGGRAPMCTAQVPSLLTIITLHYRGRRLHSTALSINLHVFFDTDVHEGLDMYSLRTFSSIII